MMIAFVTNLPGNSPTVQVEATPVCGEDFCDSCGDCLTCHVEDQCGAAENRQHCWVVYADQYPEKAAALLRLEKP